MHINHAFRLNEEGSYQLLARVATPCRIRMPKRVGIRQATHYCSCKGTVAAQHITRSRQRHQLPQIYSPIGKTYVKPFGPTSSTATTACSSAKGASPVFAVTNPEFCVSSKTGDDSGLRFGLRCHDAAPLLLDGPAQHEGYGLQW